MSTIQKIDRRDFVKLFGLASEWVLLNPPHGQPGYERLVNGQVQQVPEHTKSVNTISETQQLLGLSIVKKALYAKCTTTGEKDVEYKRMIQKEMSRKVAGDKKLERDFSKKYPSK